MKNIFRYVIIIAFLIISFTYKIMRPSALTTETIYATNSNCTFSDSGKYKNISSNGSVSTNNINTTYNGKSYGMQFYFAEDMITTKVYQLKITFMADDLLPRVNENFISLITFDISCEQDYATILSIEKNTSSGNATTMTVNFIPSMTSNKAVILIGSPSGPTQITGETTFGIKSVQIGDRESQGNEQIIINQNQNTQDIINNQNLIAEQQNEQQKVCETIDNSSKDIDNKYLNSSGQEVGNTSYIITKYIKLSKDSELKTILSQSSSSTHYCFYNTNKVLISCSNLSSLIQGELVTIPSNAEYFRSSILKAENRPTFELCKNGNQAVSDSVNDLNDSINDSSVDNSDAVDFFNNFSDNTHGLSGIISAPLNSINAMLNNQCSPLTATWKGQDISFQCGYDFWNRLSVIKSFLNIVLDGLICYRILIKLFKLIENIKKPDDDRIEVVDL